jgi:hypothetical protein
MIRTIYLVHHTHTDIGYTDTIGNVLKGHVRILDEVVDLCKANANAPDGLQYKWTIETALVLEEFQKRSPTRFRQLMSLAKKGLVEVAGLWAQSLTEAPAIQELSHLVGKTREYGAKHAFPVRSAMLTDIPVGAWALPEVLGGSDVRFLVNGDNTIRTLAPYDRSLPPLFWWEGPSGKQKVLVWHLGLSVPEDPRKLKSLYPQYALGYFFVLWPMKGWYDPTKKKYLYDPVKKCFLGRETSPEECLKMARAGIAQLCRKLEAGGYPYDAVLLQAGADNFGPDTDMCQTVRTWNEQVGTPQVRIATPAEFFEYIAVKYARRIPTLRGNISDAWSDHIATKAEETARYREAGRKLRTAGRMQALASLVGVKLPAAPMLKDAMSPLIMTSEHTYGLNTFGVHEDIIGGKLKPSDRRLSAPLKSWQLKARYSRAAERATEAMLEQAKGALSKKLPGNRPGLWVINTLDHPRGGVVDAHSSHRIIPSVPRGVTWVPSREFPSHSLQKPSRSVSKNVIENDAYRVEVDPRSGAVASLIDKQSGCELVDAESSWGINHLVVERFEGFPDYRSGGGLVKPKKRLHTGASPSSVRLKRMKWFGGEALQVQSTIHSGAIPLEISSIIRLPSYAPRVEFLNRLTREPSLAKEAVYVAFPFALPMGQTASACSVRCEVAGAILDWKRERLPGSIGDFQAIQGAVAIDRGRGSILWASPDAPLVCIGGMNSMRWLGVNDLPEKPHLFSYVMHNTWPTNCPLWQTRSVTLRYAIESHSVRPTNQQIVEFGRDFAEPLQAIVASGRSGNSTAPRLDCAGATLEAIECGDDGARVILSDINRSGGTAALHVRGARKLSGAHLCTLADGQDHVVKTRLQIAGGRVTVPLVRGGLTVVALRLK